MAKPIYIKGVRNKTVDSDRLALAYLILARALVEQEEQETKDNQGATNKTPGNDS